MSLYLDQKSQRKTLRGPTAKMGSGGKEVSWNIKSSNVGGEKQKYKKMFRFFFGCSNNLLYKQFELT